MYPHDPETPAARLARQYLVDARIHLAPALPVPLISRSLAWGSLGPDHVEGDRVVAVGSRSDQTTMDPDAFFVVTDRRLGGRQLDRFFYLPFADMVSISSRTELFEKVVRITVANGTWIDAFVAPFADQVEHFLQAMTALAPEERLPDPDPLCWPREDDPIGANWVRAGLGLPDRRTETMLRLLERGVETGRLETGVAADLTARVSLLYRNMVSGRGRRDRRWLSPLWAPDLAAAFAGLLGAPVARGGTDSDPVLEFQVGSEDGDVSGAVASSAVGLLALATLGIGWVSVPGRSLSRVRAQIHDQPAPPSYSLTDGQGTTLSIASPELLYRLNDHLMPLELDLLLRRCLWGWRLGTDEILSVPTVDLLNAVAAELEQDVDLKPFLDVFVR